MRTPCKRFHVRDGYVLDEHPTGSVVRNDHHEEALRYEADLGWIAGVLSLRGSIYLTGPKVGKKYLKINLSLADEYVVRRYAGLLGGRSVFLREQDSEYGPTWVCNITGKAAKQLLRDILPYLTEPRQELARKFL